MNSFNIIIQDVDVATFFGVPDLPPTTVSPVILYNGIQPDLPIIRTTASSSNTLSVQILARRTILQAIFSESSTLTTRADYLLRRENCLS